MLVFFFIRNQKTQGRHAASELQPQKEILIKTRRHKLLMSSKICIFYIWQSWWVHFNIIKFHVREVASKVSNPHGSAEALVTRYGALWNKTISISPVACTLWSFLITSNFACVDLYIHICINLHIPTFTYIWVLGQFQSYKITYFPWNPIYQIHS